MKYSLQAKTIATLWYGLKYIDDINRFPPIRCSTEILEPRVSTVEPVRLVHQETMVQFEIVPVQAEEVAEAGKPDAPSGPPEEVSGYELPQELSIQL